MSDSTKALVGTIAALLAMVACVAIMSRCAVQVNGIQTEASECTKHGGIWHSRFCEEIKK